MSVISNPYSDGQILTAGSMFRPIAFFNATSTIDNDTTETTLYETVLPANTVSHGIFVISSCMFRLDEANQAGAGTFRLKMGSPTVSELRAIQIRHHQDAEGESDTRIGHCLTYWENTQDWTNTTSLIITGQNNAAAAGISCAVEGVAVFGV